MIPIKCTYLVPRTCSVIRIKRRPGAHANFVAPSYRGLIVEVEDTTSILGAYICTGHGMMEPL